MVRAFIFLLVFLATLVLVAPPAAGVEFRQLTALDIGYDAEDGGPHFALELPAIGPGHRLFSSRLIRLEVKKVTDKQRALEAVQRLPEDATVEDAIERLCFIAKVQKGIRELDAGQGISHEDAKRRIVGG